MAYTNARRHPLLCATSYPRGVEFTAKDLERASLRNPLHTGIGAGLSSRRNNHQRPPRASPAHRHQHSINWPPVKSPTSNPTPPTSKSSPAKSPPWASPGRTRTSSTPLSKPQRTPDPPQRELAEQAGTVSPSRPPCAPTTPSHPPLQNRLSAKGLRSEKIPLSPCILPHPFPDRLGMGTTVSKPEAKPSLAAPSRTLPSSTTPSKRYIPAHHNL